MKFSIVTPVYNNETYIEETIKSVLSQKGDFEIEYIISDGGSTDGSVTIAKKYQELLSQNQFPILCKSITMIILSEKDRGMYDAINKGFRKATGDVYAWINSDDIYNEGALEIIAKTFSALPQIDWLKGITSFIDKNGNRYQYGRCFLYNQKWIQMGIYGRNAYFIHQDSVFWKKELWEKAGGVDSNLKHAGDYALWITFSKHAPLWSLNYQISCFRKRDGQLSGDMNAYRQEQKNISRPAGFLNAAVKLFFWLQSKRPHWLNPLFLLIYRSVFINRNDHYIEVKDGQPFIKKTSSYTV